MPQEARLRKISYSAPIYMEVSAHINGVQREDFKLQIGNLPIMLKSKYCHLNGASEEELIKAGEDPNDPGGYFIVNGTEKVLVKIEDLASNRLMVEKASTGMSKFVGKIFSERGSYKIPHQFEKLKDGLFYLTFTRVKRIPVVLIMKGLGMLKDEDIMNIDWTRYNGILVLAVMHEDMKSEFIYSSRAKRHVIREGDILVVVGYEEDIKEFEKKIGSERYVNWSHWSW